MKSGKFIPLGTHKEVKVGYGTVDFKNLKTVYIKMNAWVEPKEDDIDFEKVISRTRKKIKEYLRNQDLQGYFKKDTIVDLDIRTKGIKINKRSFMNLEITLFVDKFFDVKSNNVKNILKNTVNGTIDTCLIDKTLFNFNKTKI
jgi:hypothetical protein